MSEQRAHDTILHQEDVEEVIEDVIEDTVISTASPEEAIEDAVDDASESHALNATFSDTEVEAALNALGENINSVAGTLNEVLAALRSLNMIEED